MRILLGARRGFGVPSIILICCLPSAILISETLPRPPTHLSYPPHPPLLVDGLNDTYASDTTKASQCVVVNQGYKPSDVKTFQSKYGLPNQV